MPLGTLLMTLIAGNGFARTTVARHLERSPSAALLTSLALALVCAFVFVRFHYRPDYNGHYATVFESDGPALRKELPPGTRLLSVDDGIIAYATEFPTLSGTGLMLDREAIAAWHSGQLVDLALQRGYDHLTSFSYANLAHPRVALRQTMRLIARMNSDPIRFSARPVYRSAYTTLGVVALQLRGE
jgi:hypothetical protein